MRTFFVGPAKAGAAAGIGMAVDGWIPAFAGMTQWSGACDGHAARADGTAGF